MKIDRNVHLGSDSDPHPVFRDEAPAGVRRSEGTSTPCNPESGDAEAETSAFQEALARDAAKLAARAHAGHRISVGAAWETWPDWYD